MKKVKRVRRGICALEKTLDAHYLLIESMKDRLSASDLSALRQGYDAVHVATVDLIIDVEAAAGKQLRKKSLYT